MIVDGATLDVRPIADALLEAERGRDRRARSSAASMAWSNELALHVIELKTNGPAPSLAGLAERFAGEVARDRTRCSRRSARG